jgi:hypothetical protein
MNEPAPNRPDTAKPATLRRSALDVAATWVTIVSVVLGGAFALFRYSDDSQGARAKEALTYIQRFAEPPVSTSFEAFTHYWLTRGFKDSDTDASMVAAIQDQSIEPDALVVIRFFDSAAACTCKHLCDEDLVRHFLGTEAYDFFSPAGPYVYDRRKRENDPSFGNGLEAIAKKAPLRCPSVVAAR